MQQLQQSMVYAVQTALFKSRQGKAKMENFLSTTREVNLLNLLSGRFLFSMEHNWPMHGARHFLLILHTHATSEKEVERIPCFTIPMHLQIWPYLKTVLEVWSNGIQLKMPIRGQYMIP